MIEGSKLADAAISHGIPLRTRTKDPGLRSALVRHAFQTRQGRKYNFDGPGDVVPGPTMSTLSSADASNVPRPVHDIADASKDVPKFSNLEKQPVLQPDQLQTIDAAPTVVSGKVTRVLYDTPDMVEEPIKQADHSTTPYWHPAESNAAPRLTAFVRSVANHAGSSEYGAEDAVQDIARVSGVYPPSWQPQRMDQNPMSKLEETLPSTVQPHTDDAASILRSHAQQSGPPMPVPPLPPPLMYTQPPISTIGPMAKSQRSQRVVSFRPNTEVNNPGSQHSHRSWNEGISSDPEHGCHCREQQPFEEPCNQRQHRSRISLCASHHCYPSSRGNNSCHCTYHYSCRNSSPIRHELNETSTSLQSATQTLDRALINLNSLLSEAMSLAAEATQLGRREKRRGNRHSETLVRHRSHSRRPVVRRKSYSTTTSESSYSVAQQLGRRRVSFYNGVAPIVQTLTAVTIPQECVLPAVSNKVLSPEHLAVPGQPVGATDPSHQNTEGDLATIVQRGLWQPSSIDGMAQRSAAMQSFDRPSVVRRDAQLNAQHPLFRSTGSQISTRSPGRHNKLDDTVGRRTQSWAYTTPALYDDQQRGITHSESTSYILHGADLEHPRRPHLSIPGQHGIPSSFQYKQNLSAREWSPARKRITASVACCNTVFVGLLAGIYAGEVPRIQYQIADVNNIVILGNVLLYVGIAATTMLCWPLPLLHGRKPYTVAAFALMLPLQYPQALAVATFQDPDSMLARVGLLLPRLLTGLAMGFANINFLPTLLDLFGASLMSDNPHQEHVQLNDVRRQGGGIGIWLGIWSWCYVASLSVGFCVGAVIIQDLEPVWGFYITIMLLAVFLLLNIVAPETRRAPHRTSVIHIFDHTYTWRRRVAKGEIHLHLWQTGPQWWINEVWAGIVLICKMICQLGFLTMMCYLAWIFAQVVLIIVLLGALLSRWYGWRSDYVGAASLALATGALLAVPLTHGNWFSRSRVTPPRTNSMTLEHKHGIRLTSHMLRRCIFTLILPLAGLAYTLASPGPEVSWTVPVVFVGLVGFLSNLAISECIGLIMETFDTCDLQPGVNNRHREKSLPEVVKKARTHYSSYPRICAGFFAAQSLGFVLAAASTAVSGTVTRAIGAQISAASVAGILLLLTVLLLAALLRFKSLQVIPNGILDVSEIKSPWASQVAKDVDWRPVILGNPSGKLRRTNLLELGRMSRWTEIRRLNGLE